MDGVYKTSINSPMGNIDIHIALQQNGNIINGMIEIMGSKNPLENGRVNGNRCYFRGELKNGTMNLKYEIQAELVQDVLNIHARTSMGEFKLEAHRILAN